jgi:hypothetical protein
MTGACVITVLLVGRVTEALPLLEQAKALGSATGTMGGQSLRVRNVSEAYLLGGRRQEAVQLDGRALDLSRAHKERGYQAWACGSSGRSLPIRTLRRSSQPHITTGRPSPWRKNSAYASS